MSPLFSFQFHIATDMLKANEAMQKSVFEFLKIFIWKNNKRLKGEEKSSG
jgi:hypothetical protein